MSTINGTITGVHLLAGNPSGAGENTKAFLIDATFPAYTGSSDSATITGCLTAIAAAERNGRTLTLRHAARFNAGLDAATPPIAVYVDNTISLSNTTTTGDLAFDLADKAGTELTATTGVSTGVGVIVIVDES